MRLLQWIGISSVVCGALTLNFASGGGSILATMFKSLKNERGSVLMIATAACWGVAAPFDKIALSRASIPTHAFTLGAGVGLVLLTYVVLRGQHRSILAVNHCKKPLIAAMLFAIAALGIQLVAYSEGFVGLAETIKRVIGMTSSLILGYFLFNEQIVRAQIWGVILMSLGVALIL
ncbi:MAG: drug/metabolite transporter (DMT)-like permease [Planctomycetota bacterium]|jgi:drug/metabolite transporter (DMT)-like permease